MKFLAFIPARYASTRFPGKPLADIGGKTMIQRVYERLKEVKEIDDIFVLTDDERISKQVENFGGKVLMTDVDIPNGTHRCHQGYEIYLQKGGEKAEVILNVQGDEPFIRTEAIKQLMSCFDSEKVEIATLAKQIEKEEDLLDPNIVKLVFSVLGKALYFSRSPIPYIRDRKKGEDIMNRQCFYKHIGLYAYRPSVLSSLVKLETTKLEDNEKLEQLRWLENNLDIWVKPTDYESFSVDTPKDLEILNTSKPWI